MGCEKRIFSEPIQEIDFEDETDEQIQIPNFTNKLDEFAWFLNRKQLFLLRDWKIYGPDGDLVAVVQSEKAKRKLRKYMRK